MRIFQIHQGNYNFWVPHFPNFLWQSNCPYHLLAIMRNRLKLQAKLLQNLRAKRSTLGSTLTKVKMVTMMKMSSTIPLFSLLTLISFNAYSACPQYYRLFGLTNLQKKSWETTNVDTKVKKICKPLPVLPNANLEITLSKNKAKFKTRIFRSLTGYWDSPEKDGKWSGGTFPLDFIEVNTLVPTWYKGSTMKITDIVNKQTLVETKL